MRKENPVNQIAELLSFIPARVAYWIRAGEAKTLKRQVTKLQCTIQQATAEIIRLQLEFDRSETVLGELTKEEKRLTKKLVNVKNVAAIERMKKLQAAINDMEGDD